MLRALGIALLAAVIAIAAGAAAFLSGVDIPAEFLRPRLERALSAAFGLPTRLEGPLRMRTGRIATLSADALVVADPAAGPNVPLGRGIRPRARIDLPALLRGTVALEEVTGERLELNLARSADGRGNWAPIFAPSPGGGQASVTFYGIAHLRIGSIIGAYLREGGEPAPFEIADFDGALPRRSPITARGRVRSGGQAFAVELRTASLAELSAATAPIRGVISWSGLRASFDGEFARDGSRLDARVEASAPDAGAPLSALGIAAREAGPLEARLRLSLSSSEATLSELALRVGETSTTGELGVVWGAARPRVTGRLKADSIDPRPFSGEQEEKFRPESFVDWLERIATGFDAELTLSAAEIAGLAFEVREATVEARSSNLALDVKAGARVSGVQLSSSLAYDARQPQRTLAARLDSGTASTAALGAEMRPQGWTVGFAALRGRLDAAGNDPRSIVASTEGEFEARDLRWTIDRGQVAALDGRFDRLRASVRRDGAVAADAAGRLGGAACSLKLSGASLAPLLAGEAWPVQASGTCPGERFSARGTVTRAGDQSSAELTYEVAADKPGTVAGLLGAKRLPTPLSARGNLSIREDAASVKFAALRFGRSSGAGEAAWPLGTAGTARVRLALTALDLDELRGPAGSAPADPLQREVLPPKLPLPDLDFDLDAERVVVADTTLRRAQFAGALRAQKLPPAKFRFDSEGLAIAGQFGADFSDRTPHVEIEAATRDADLGPWLARLGRKDIGLRAAALSLRAQAQGTRAGELLASAAVNGAMDRARLLLHAADSSQASAIDFSAALEVAPGRPTRLTAKGAADGAPVQVSLDAGALSELARAGESIPLTLAAASGDARLEATGRVAFDGTGAGRFRLTGRRLERLGALIGAALPAVEPYSASGNLRVTTSAIRADELELAFGRSRLAGSVEFSRAAASRRSHRAGLRATALHLEDVGGDRWLRFEEAPREEPPRAEAVAQATSWLLDLVRDADFDIAFDLDSLLGAGQPLAGGNLTARAAAGTLRVNVREVFTAGGELNADLRAEARSTPPAFALKAQARGLEYGPLLRALDSTTSLEGGLDFNVDLAARAQPEQVLRELGGTTDVATFPRGLRSRALNLWGVGIVNGLLRQLDPESGASIDCAVTSFDVERGVARSRGFFVDTTRVRIVGELEIDLVTRELRGRIDPISKAPQLLAVAPTMTLGGTADDPRVSAAPQNIVTLPLRFVTTLGGLLGDWRSLTGRAADGSAACREAFRLLQPAAPPAK